MPTKIYITGVSGTGKSTLVKELNKRGIAAFDIDAVPDLCHWRNKETHEGVENRGIGRDWVEAHEWICNVSKLKELLAKADNMVVVGLASNQDEYLHLFDRVFLLHCREEVFLHRLNTREGDDEFAKEKSEQEYILSWYKDFEDTMLKSGATPLNGEEPINVIADKIVREI